VSDSYIGLARTVYTPYMTVYIIYYMISLPKMPYINCIYMVLANPTHILLRLTGVLLVVTTRDHVANE